MDGLYFDGSPEPNDFTWIFHQAVTAVAKEQGIHLITLDFDNQEDYYNALNELQGFTDSNVRVSTSSKADDRSIIIEPAVDLDDRRKDTKSIAVKPGGNKRK